LGGYIPVYTRIPLPAGSNPVGIIYPRKQPLPDESVIQITQGYAYKFYGANRVLGVPESKVPDVILGATPTIIPYSINQEVREVAIRITNALGTEVAHYANSAPSPDDPIPFIWNGKYIGRDWYTDQKDVPTGRYNAVLVAKLKERVYGKAKADAMALKMH
jgi:hypothetical protein